MKSFNNAGSTASTFSKFSPGSLPGSYGGISVVSRFIAWALTVSFVWLDSMSAISVWNRLSRALAPGSASRSQPIVSTAAFAAAPLPSRISLATAYISSQSDGGLVVAAPVVGSVVARAGLRTRRAGGGLLGEEIGVSIFSVLIAGADLPDVVVVAVRFRFREAVRVPPLGGGDGVVDLMASSMSEP
jgi:hypothetical protein